MEMDTESRLSRFGNVKDYNVRHAMQTTSMYPEKNMLITFCLFIAFCYKFQAVNRVSQTIANQNRIFRKTSKGFSFLLSIRIVWNWYSARSERVFHVLENGLMTHERWIVIVIEDGISNTYMLGKYAFYLWANEQNWRKISRKISNCKRNWKM